MNQAPSSPLKPLLLLADSQLLFWRREGELFLDRVRRELSEEGVQAAYVGASNGDRREFYELFRAAMEGIGITDCRMIPSHPSTEDLAFLSTAHLILLAGGDPVRGLKVMQENGVCDKVLESYSRGAFLMGVSAGAIQLALYVRAGEEDPPELLDAFKLVPYLIDVHDEPTWERLRKSLVRAPDFVEGMGVPGGGGILVHPDLTVEPVCRPAFHLRRDQGELRESLLLPPESEG